MTQKFVILKSFAKGFIMIRFFSFYFIITCVIGLLTTCTDAEQAQSLTCIIIPTNASPAEQYAAQELCTYIEKMTGRKLSILSDNQPLLTGRVITLGRTETNLKLYNPDSWPLDTIYIGYNNPYISIIGQGDQGTLFAAYEFLRGQGCRWYMPGPDGEYVPKRENLDLAKEFCQYTPSFRARGWCGTPASEGVNQLYLDWAVRNGLNSFVNRGGAVVEYPAELGYGYQSRQAHTLIALIPSSDHPDREKTFAEHPEWYPLVDGKRVWQYTDGRPVQACLSNPEVAQEAARKVVEYFHEHPRCRRFSVSHNDEPSYWCECDKCRAMDSKGSKWERNNILDAYPDKSPAGPGPMSDRYVKFINSVAQIVAKECPGKYISFYAYGSTVAPPRDADLKLEKNVIIEYSHGCEECLRHDLFDQTCRTNTDLVKWLGGWRKLGEVIYYDYPPMGPNFNLPTCFTHSYKRYLEGLKRLDVSGFSGENQGTWAGSGLFHYLEARLLWDINTDSNGLVEECCRDMYGDALPEMIMFYQTFDKKLQEFPGHLVWGRWIPQLKKETLQELDGYLKKAAAKAGSPVVIKRIKMMQAAMNNLIISNMADSIKTQTDTDAFDRYSKLCHETLALIEQIDEPFPYVVMPQWLEELKSTYRPPFEAMKGCEILTLPLIWRFRTDANDSGTKEQWRFGADVNTEKWKDIRTNASWTDQGFDYHGIAWYITTINIPKNITGRLWLLFEILDGSADIWIDGKPAGSLPASPYDKPKAIEITSVVKDGGEYRLAIRVVKDNYAAGILKPVKLIQSDPVIGSQ